MGDRIQEGLVQLLTGAVAGALHAGFDANGAIMGQTVYGSLTSQR